MSANGSLIPIQIYPTPPDVLVWKGKYIDNGILSNLTLLSRPLVWEGREFGNVEAAYVAAKNPYVEVNGYPFIDLVSMWCKKNGPYGVKHLGIPKTRGGLIDAREDWDIERIGVMLSLLSLKFAPDTPEALWLMDQDPLSLVEYNNWGDRFWGAIYNEKKAESRGRNILGELLIIVRERLLANNPIAYIPSTRWAVSQQYIIDRLIKARS